LNASGAKSNMRASLYKEKVAAWPRQTPLSLMSCETTPCSIRKRRPDFAIRRPREPVRVSRSNKSESTRRSAAACSGLMFLGAIMMPKLGVGCGFVLCVPHNPFKK
jgi:hypothetical protein